MQWRFRLDHVSIFSTFSTRSLLLRTRPAHCRCKSKMWPLFPASSSSTPGVTVTAVQAAPQPTMMVALPRSLAAVPTASAARCGDGSQGWRHRPKSHGHSASPKSVPAAQYALQETNAAASRRTQRRLCAQRRFAELFKAEDEE